MLIICKESHALVQNIFQHKVFNKTVTVQIVSETCINVSVIVNPQHTADVVISEALLVFR